MAFSISSIFSLLTGGVSKVTTTIGSFWFKVSIALLILLSVAGYTFKEGYDIGYQKRDDAAQISANVDLQTSVKNLQAIHAQYDALQKNYNGLETQLQTAQSKASTIGSKTHAQVIKEIHTNTVYQSCVVPASGVQILANQAAELNALRPGSSSSSGSP